MSDSLPPNLKSCTQCGAELPDAGTNGLCPACLMGEAMQPTIVSDASKPKNHSAILAPEDLAPFFPQYEILRMLGRGGMGAVYLARQLSLNRLVAIKILPADLGESDQGFAERFKNEAQAMAQLSHPGIVAVFDFGQTANGLLYIVMEYIEGTDVQLMLASQGRLHSAHAMAITAHVCDALQYAHSCGIIHRDIKPSNIMVGNNGVVKVADFGLAKMSQGQTTGLTQSGMAMGTLHFMAPEALTLGSAVDQRADIYAVGVMLYQMLTGKLPQGMFEMPSFQVPGLDPRYDRIVAKALREDREVRYQAAVELRHDLDAILTQPVEKVEAAAAKPPAALETQARPQRPGGQPYRPPQQNTLRPAPSKSSSGMILAVVAMLVLAGAAAFYFRGMDRGQVDQSEPSTNVAANGGDWVDLLPLADPQSDAVSGKWTRVAAGLHGEIIPGTKGAQVLQLPYEPPEEYDFRIAYTTLEGNREASQILSAFGHQFTWGTASGQPEKWSGFNMINGKPMMLNGAGVKLPAPREMNRRYESLVEVRRDRVTGYVDGEKLVEWKTDYSELSMDPSHAIPNPRALGIGIWWSKTVFHEIEVREVNGQGKRLREPDAAPVTTTVKAAPSPAEPAQATKEQPFVNSLGMKFVPVPITGGPTDGQRVLFSVWETRVQDYEVFVKETKREWSKSGFVQGPTHPAVNVSWEDASAFCTWLTEREREAGRLSAQENYRLPSDHEWSCAVGIGDKEDAAKLPHEKHQQISDVFPWGTQWPPPAQTGNYASEELRPLLRAGKISYAKDVIADYLDGHAATSPVGSYMANRLGLFDLGGNAWEWCEEWFDGNHRGRVRRGGSWFTYEATILRSSNRSYSPPLPQYAYNGFRCVLEAPTPAVISLTTENAATATKPAPFTNTLGMKFVPVPIGGGPTKGEPVLFSIWDTRVQDYLEFARANKVDGGWQAQQKDGVPVSLEPGYPVVGVSWEDAQAFCQWLNAKETAEGKLPPGMKYRLPSDEEWSWAAGMPSEPGATPAEKSDKNEVDFPWGIGYPPPGKLGNYADEAYHTKFPKPKAGQDPKAKNWIVGYDDGHATTSPVGRFSANAHGLYDMGGNVFQWCEDWFDKDQKERVLRGASWDAGDRNTLRSSRRRHSAPENRGYDHGFRCVLALAFSPSPALPVSPSSTAATKPAPFTNTLGMKFVPVPITGGPTDKQRVLFSVWETREEDYRVFAKETKLVWKNDAEVEHGTGHPVVNVSWKDAQVFCAWLTERERKSGMLGAGEQYRLPSDHEWSCAVGIGDRENAAHLPDEKTLRLTDVFPWGEGFPPPANSGNYWSEELRPLQEAGKHGSPTSLPGFRDGHATTAPVGSYAASPLGLYDLGGNVRELCEDWYDASQQGRVTRGSSWLTGDAGRLRSSGRGPTPADHRNYTLGFRCVVAESSPASSAVSAAMGNAHTFAGHRYQLVKEHLDFDQAKARAEAMGAHLVTITSREERDFLASAYREALRAVGREGINIGGVQDIPGAPWNWSTGESFSFTDWGPGEPNRAGVSRDGRAVTRLVRDILGRPTKDEFQWDDVPPTQARQFIVEWDDDGGTSAATTKEAPFTNTLGMQFVPVPITGGPTDKQRVLFSIWETRVQDYEVFAKETQREWLRPDFSQGLTHPVVKTSWDDAQAFCAWLTEKERKAGRLGVRERYRLPSDHEWSCAVSIGRLEDAGKPPSEKSLKIKDAFPWGGGWPPSERVGNYAGEELKPALSAGTYRIPKIMEGYRDDFVETAPVGNFPANLFGLHDLGGNAWEWCEDWYDEKQIDRVQRGASWLNADTFQIPSSNRGHMKPASSNPNVGFRCVLELPKP